MRQWDLRQDQIYNSCGTYYASKKQTNVHFKKIHGHTICDLCYRAKTVLKRRGKELMCEIEGTPEPIIEWFEEEDVEINQNTSQLNCLAADEDGLSLMQDLYAWLALKK